MTELRARRLLASLGYQMMLPDGKLYGAAAHDLPERLVRFDPADWPDAEQHTGDLPGWTCGSFWAARKALEAEHVVELPLHVETAPGDVFDPEDI